MKYVIVLWLILLTACSNLNTPEPPHDEYSILLTNLLKLNNDKYSYIDAKGKRQPDLLKKFKELEGIYIKNVKPDLADNKFNNNRLKIIMYFSFYSVSNNSAAFQEYLAADLMPIYINNSDAFLSILNELPFLIPSNCNRLDSFFGFEGENAEKRSTFIKQNSSQFQRHLNSEQYELCLSYFNKKPGK